MSTDLLKAGSEFLRAQRKAHMASPITYVRGSTQLTLQATGGRSQAETTGTDGDIVVSSSSQDFLITAADLKIAGVQFEPRTGDQIIDTQGGFVTKYEVMPMLGEPCFTECDRFGGTLRIHTRQVAQEVAA